MDQEQQLLHYALYILASVSISFWSIIWVMHLCALTNAKMKFSKKSYLFAGNKRKTKLALYQHQHHQLVHKPHGGEQAPRQITTTTTSFPSTNDDGLLQELASKKQQAQQQQHELFSTIDRDGVHGNGNGVQANNSKLEPDRWHHSDANCDTIHCLSYKDASEKPDKKHLEQPIADNTQSSLIDLNSNINSINSNNISNLTSHYFYINLPLPGVSIIKPLMGIDKNLFFNLETFFHLDYPTYELLFCVQDPNDPAALIVEQLFKKYPQADARLFIGGSRVGVNPKINNMQPAYESMRYELLLISDSGIQMKPDTLIDMVSHMNDDVALVHQMPFVNFHERNTFESIVERVYFGTVHARAYLTADLLNINCSTGMSALMRKCLLDEVGGIKAFGQYLAEDFFFAKSFTERGWKICISSQPALQNSANSSETLSTLNSRIQRWIKLRFAMVPQWTLIEPFSECMLLGLLGATSISFMWAFNPVTVFAIHVLVWFLLDYKLICSIQNEPLTCSKGKFLAAWLCRECTALLVFTKALADPKVTWRSREFKIRWGGYTEEVSESPDKKATLDHHLPILTKKPTDFLLHQQQKLPHNATCEV